METWSQLLVVAFGTALASFALGLLAGRRLPAFRREKRARQESDRGNGRSGARSTGTAGSRLIELYVGNLSYDISEKEMHKIFSQHGRVATARIISNKFNGKSRGFGFVEMEDQAGADAACRALNGKDIKGRKIVVNEAK